MRVLVTWGSKHGGTEGIAQMIAAALRDAAIDVELRAAREVATVAGFDAAIVGGALYANRWHRDARRFVTRHLVALQRVPIWLFSSGPLDDSAARTAIPPATQVAVLMERTGALGHATFGGRLA
ncbi:MAG TPA: flavodoxin domain-containing protein, partial [Kofleriaceae bacterium]